MIGDTAAVATSRLTAQGFTVIRHTKKVTNQSQDGIVLSQTPGAGTQAKKNSSVVIVIGKFTPPTTTTTTTTTTSTPSSTTTTTSTTSPTGAA